MKPNLGNHMRTIYLLLIAVILCPAFNLHATPALLSDQSVPANTIVSVVADAQGLSLVPPDQVPPFGTFWMVTPGIGGASPAPLPCPPVDTTLPIYAVADGQFLVDATGGSQPPLASPQATRLMASTTSAAVLQAQAGAIADLITQIQTTTANAQVRTLARAMGINDLSPGGGDDSGQDYTPASGGVTIDTNALWLEITNVSNGCSYLNLHNATNQVYAIWSTINLTMPFSAWQVETEVWPTDTNCMPFTLLTQNRQNLFLRAEDWTGVTENGNTTPDWWFWLYFGTTALLDNDLDSQGNSFLYDYQLGLDPNIISFTFSFTNQFANASDVPLQLSVTAGIPSYFAVLVDDTNAADATWLAYNSSNIIANLGYTQGWHQVYVGLRGLPPNAYQTWQNTRLKLDSSPPLLVITNLAPGTVTRPVIQLQGYSPKALTSISYDLTNAVGLATNQQTLILGQYYDTNSLELTTNYFQCFDIPLTNGPNTITLHATDLAGNTTTTNFTFILDYSSATNPPTVQLGWPQAGTKISGNSFTWRGQVSDPTAQVVAQIVNTNGMTNTVSGRVGRDGDFWIDSMPLSGGVNNLSLIVTDAAGNTSVKNIPVMQSSLVLTITSAGLGQAVAGTISDTNYTIWVNGIMATNNMDGTWIAPNPHLTLDTPTVQVRAIPNWDNGGNGGGQ